MQQDLLLRPAIEHDAYALWVWANDPDTRRASHGRAAIGWRGHKEWFSNQLSSADARVLIAETAERRPIGTVRFDSEDNWATARLSYLVAPEARGLGLSRPMTSRAIGWLSAHHPDSLIFAEVLSDNARSLRVFRALGWRETVAAGLHRFESK